MSIRLWSNDQGHCQLESTHQPDVQRSFVFFFFLFVLISLSQSEKWQQLNKKRDTQIL